jgi:hypothetical protein
VGEHPSMDCVAEETTAQSAMSYLDISAWWLVATYMPSDW